MRMDGHACAAVMIPYYNAWLAVQLRIIIVQCGGGVFLFWLHSYKGIKHSQLPEYRFAEIVWVIQ